MTERAPSRTVRLAEAVNLAEAVEYTALRDAIQGVLRDMVGDDTWPYIVALYSDPQHVVVEVDGALTRYVWDWDGAPDEKPELTDATAVVASFEVVEMSEAAPPSSGALIEAQAGRPGRFAARIIRAGLSVNGCYYSDAVLRESVALCSGARVLMRSDEDHLTGRNRSVSTLIGRIVEPRFVEAQGGGAIEGVLELIEPNGPIATKLREAVNRNMQDLMGLSIVASGRARVGQVEGRPVRLVESISAVSSVDLVVEPSAGGALIGLIEAVNQPDNGDARMRDRMIRLIKARLGEARLTEAVLADDDALEALYREAVAIQPAGGTGGTGTPPAAPAAPSLEDIDARIAESVSGATRLVEARADARVRVAGSNLPQAARDRLSTRLAEASAEDLTTERVDAAIEAERVYLAEAGLAGAQVTGLGGGSGVQGGETQAEKWAAMCDALFDPANNEVVSLRECYVEITGDSRVTGLLRNCDQSRLAEAISTAIGGNAGALGELLGTAMHRRLLADYRQTMIYDWWGALCTTVPLSDFRQVERITLGGYGDLPTVAEGADYAAQASPKDTAEKYSPAKKGGTESITLEAVRNDDVGLVMRLPTQLSRAAKRTLSSVVGTILTANGNMADGVALFHGTHNNLGTTALSGDALNAARTAMRKQTTQDTTKRVGIGPRSIVVPFELEKTAFDLFRRDTNNDQNFINSLSLDVVPCPELTDANDWYLFTDPADIPTIEVGFLDGQQEPELFVQDNPSVGSLFTADKITYKIRHIYGAKAVDFRGMFKAAVA